MSTLVLLIVIVFTCLIGWSAIKEGQRIESQKKFIKNLNNFDNRRRNTLSKVERTYKSKKQKN